MPDSSCNIDPGDLAHIGIVVKDIDESRKHLSAVFGLDQWTTFDYAAEKETMAVGEPFNIKVAGTMLGPVAIELIQPVACPYSVWGQHLERHGEGIHHIAFKVKDFDETVSKFAEKGAMVLLSVIPAEGIQWGYIITAPGSIIMECMNFDLKF